MVCSGQDSPEVVFGVENEGRFDLKRGQKPQITGDFADLSERLA
jgi:hypothetical protein